MQSKLLVLNCESSNTEDIIDQLNLLSDQVNMRSRSDDGQQSELVFELISKDHNSSLEELKKLDGVRKIRLLNYSANN